MHRTLTLLGAGAFALLTSAGQAQTVTVDTLEDVIDFGGAQTVADLPGPDGRVSFREAVFAANNTPGPQTIEFAIPRDEWWLVDDMAVLRLETADVVPVDDDGLTIDFSTQTDFTGDTNPDGTEVGIYGVHPNGAGSPAILVNASDCVFRGLGQVWRRSSSIAIWGGDNNSVVGCVTDAIVLDPLLTGSTTGNLIGGTSPEDANDLGSVALHCGATDNLVIGNTLRTVRIEGYPSCSTPPARNRIGGPSPEERNVIKGYGSFSSEGFPVGLGVGLRWAEDNLIENNTIGLTADGQSGAPRSGPTGVQVADSSNTVIRNNVIAAQRVMGQNHYAGQLFGQAILITAMDADTVGTIVEGNRIGTDVSGENAIRTLNGIKVESVRFSSRVRDTRIGGLEPDQQNLIAFTDRTGLLVREPTEDTEISGNSIHSNGFLGIDLGTWGDGADGVTFNDPGDGDTAGGNLLQNFPVLDSAEGSGGLTRIIGSLDSRPSRGYRVEFFANGACDPSGHGEGRRFLGATTVTTGGDGQAAIDVELASSVDPGEFVTATATDLTLLATSEFAACVAAEGGCPADFNGDGQVNTQDVLAFLNAWAAGDSAADFNGDGDVNTLDVLAFLNAWSAGC